MKIFICCSKHFYDKIPNIQKELEKQGHNVQLPNSYSSPFKEEEIKRKSINEHREWKANMIREQGEKVKANDAILVLNYKKEEQENYIGGATFLEIFKAFELRKKIFFINPIPNNNLKDELMGMNPIILMGNLSNIN